MGSILAEVVLNERTTKEVPRHIVARAIANARSTLGHFLRGEDMPATTFPAPAELRTLLGEGDALTLEQGDPIGPLRQWLSDHPMPDFHESET